MNNNISVSVQNMYKNGYLRIFLLIYCMYGVNIILFNVYFIKFPFLLLVKRG